MKTLDLKFGSIKEMLSKDQMKLISGGSCTFYWSSAPGCAGGTSIVDGSQAGGMAIATVMIVAMTLIADN